MSESFTDDLDQYAGPEEQDRMDVSQVVETNPGHAASTDELRERIRQQLEVDRLAVGASEDMAVGVVAVELGILVLTVLPPGVQDFDGPRVAVDRPARRAGLPPRFVEFEAEGHERSRLPAPDARCRDRVTPSPAPQRDGGVTQLRETLGSAGSSD
jgi:hypothetical protein